MSEEIFNKILNNSATESEKSFFYKSLEEDSTQREIYYHYKNLYSISGLTINKHNHLKDGGFERLWNRMKPMKKLKMFDLWYRYAAVFIIALSLGFMVQYHFQGNKAVSSITQRIEYTSEKGSVSTIHLEDGSEIWMSSGSKITILKSSSDEMSVQLNGEAYFDMVPNPSRKFTVDLGYFKVEDIGTKFNIRAYHDEGGVYATLVDGQIDLYGSKSKPMFSMKPGEYMRFDKKTNSITLSKRDPSIATAWKDGKFVFIDKTMAEICRELENWYNVQIIIQNKSLADTKYTSVIKRTTTVSMVLKILSLTDKINYKIKDGKEAQDIIYIY